MKSLITLALATLVFATAGAQTRKNCCEKAAEAESAFYNPTATQLLRSVPAQVKERTITAQGDSLLVSFEAEIPADYLASREAYVMTPVLTTGQGTVTLPALSVEGRNYNLVKMLQKDKDQHIAYQGEAMTVKYQQLIPATDALKSASLRVDTQRQSLCACDKNKAAKLQKAKPAKPEKLKKQKPEKPEKVKPAKPEKVKPAKPEKVKAAKPEKVKTQKAEKAGRKPQLITGPGPVIVPVPEVAAEPEKPALPDLSAFEGKTQKLYYTPAGYTVKERYVNDFGAKSLFNPSGTWVKMSVFKPAMTDVIAQYDSLKNQPGVKIDSITIKVSSSPEGPYYYNDILAQLRRNQISALISKSFKQLDPAIVKIVPEPENWDGFSKALEASDIAAKDEIAKIVSETADPDQREAALRKRADWPQVLALFQEMRNCNIAIEYEAYKEYPHNCKVNEQGLIESCKKNRAGYITVKDAKQIAENEKTPAHLNNLLAAYIEAGSYQKAKECAACIDDKDLTPAIANNLGVLHSLTGDKANAEKYFAMAAALPAADYNKGVMLLNAGDKEAAAKLLSPYIQ